MEFLEKDLEQIIWESDSKTLIKKGLELSGRRFRQLRIGNYGVADLVTVEKKTTYEPYIKNGEDVYKVSNSYLLITVYELKKDKIGIGAFLQAVGYVKGIKSYLKKRGYGDTMLFKICLIGKSVDTSGNFSFIPDLINFSDPDEQPFYDMGMILDINFITYKMTINGLGFKYKNNYTLVEEGF